jgi:hypothetical protein
VVYTGEKGGYSTLGKAVFTKGSMFHGLPGYTPTAQVTHLIVFVFFKNPIQ